MSATATPLDVIEGRALWCVVHGDSRRTLDASVTAAIPVDALQKLLKQCEPSR